MEDSEKDTVIHNVEAVATEQEQVIEKPEPEQVSEAPAQPEQESQVNDDVDERGVPWKNRFMETQRKLEEMPEIIQKTVQESLNKQNKQEYTKENIPYLKQYAVEHPEYASWVEQQIDDIRAKETANLVRQELTSFQQQQKMETIRKQSEDWVTNHPEFKQCFNTDASGNKVWNMTNPLSQIMGQILNSPDPLTGKMVKDRADGLSVAAELAYARYALSQKGKTVTQITQMKKDLKKAQKVSMAQSVGTGNAQASPRSPIQKSLDEYGKTYNRKMIQDSVKQFLIASGQIQE